MFEFDAQLENLRPDQKIQFLMKEVKRLREVVHKQNRNRTNYRQQIHRLEAALAKYKNLADRAAIKLNGSEPMNSKERLEVLTTLIN
jgi:hypothetical protein